MSTLEDLFDIRYDESDNFFAETKETFQHTEDDFDFNYKYCIEANVVEGATFYALMFVPTYNSLNAKKQKSVLDCSGVNEDEVEIYDVCSYGLYIQMKCEQTEGEEIQESMLENLAQSMRAIDALRGFFLDKAQNHIGESGWDLLEKYIK